MFIHTYVSTLSCLNCFSSPVHTMDIDTSMDDVVNENVGPSFEHENLEIEFFSGNEEPTTTTSINP